MAARRVLCVRTLSCVVLFVSVTLCSSNLKCTDIKHPFRLKQHNPSLVPVKPISGAELSICQRETTCCTNFMEEKLRTESQRDYNKAIEQATNFIRSTFISRTARFNEFFTELLANAKKGLHTMFNDAYGVLYMQNSQVFMDLFHDLERYYGGTDINLEDAQKDFFAELFQKMFILLNQSYKFDEKYLMCVSKHMDELKPFGDVPEKLSGQVKRAFIAARTFVQGLAIGRDIILDVLKIEPTQLCQRAVMKMTYCPFCSGLPNTKPCPNYCLNVMKGCLAQLTDLNESWDSYIKSLMMVADRLEGPFNIESVVDPIDLKISDAIMHFQENAVDVSTKIFAGCGTPRLARRKRQVNYDDSYDALDMNKRKGKKGHVRPTTAAGTSLDILVRDIRDKVELAKGVWKNLPYAMCTEEKGLAMPRAELEYKNCWNGTDDTSYTHEVVSDGFRRQKNNPEVPVDTSNKDFMITHATLKLKSMTSKLQNAYYGLDVNYVDMADDGVRTGGNDGSGSGDGSGDGSADGSGYRPNVNTGFRPGHKVPTNPNNPFPRFPVDPSNEDDITFSTAMPKSNQAATNQPSYGEVGGTASSIVVTVSTLLIPLVGLFVTRW